MSRRGVVSGIRPRVALPVALMLALVASGCGFQLRGQVRLPESMSVTYIQPSTLAGSTPVSRALARRLRAAGVRVATDPAEATVSVHLLREDLRRRTLATGANGEIREYQLRLLVDYRAVRADGSTLLARDSVEVSRDLLYEETRVLGRADGEELALDDMAGDVAWFILRRLQATGQS